MVRFYLPSAFTFFVLVSPPLTKNKNLLAFNFLIIRTQSKGSVALVYDTNLKINKFSNRSSFWLMDVVIRGGVEDTRLEAKAKDTKKIGGQSQGQEQPFRGQTLSRPRAGMLEAKAKDKGHKRKCSPKKEKVFKNFFQTISKKKKVFTEIFQAISTKKRFPKNFSSTPQNFNNSKNSAVLEPRTGQFSRT